MAKELKEEKRLLLRNASLVKRLFAYFIDLFIVSFVALFFLRDKFSVNFSQLVLFDMNNIAPEFLQLSYYLSIALFFYFVMCELFTKQTIGKNLLNLYVVSIDKISFFDNKIKEFSRLRNNNNSKKTKTSVNANTKEKEDLKKTISNVNDDFKINISEINDLLIGKLGFFQGFIRSLYLLPLFSVISSFDVITIFFTKHKQRIFEFISGSTVVEVAYEEKLLV